MTKDKSTEISLFAIVDAVRRRKLYLILPTIALTAGFAYYAYQQPDLYSAQTLIVAQPMATVQDYVEAAGAPHANHFLNVEEQLQQARQTLFADGVFELVVEELGLADGRTTAVAAEDLRNRVQVDLQEENSLHLHAEPTVVSFYITVQGLDPVVIRDVANRLGTIFIERASAQRGQRVDQVATFIDGELDQVRGRLERQDAQLQDYKRQAIQELPEQMATNLRMLESLQDELLRTAEILAADENRIAAIRAEMSELEKQGALEITEEKSANRTRLDDLGLQLKGLEARYTANHPEVVRVRGEIVDLEQIVAGEGRDTRVQPSPLYGRYVQLQGERDAIEQRLAAGRQDRSGVEGQIETYRRRIEATSGHERVLAELTRDYATTQEQYERLLERQQNAALARSFESQNQGIIFRMASPAVVPGAPYSPQRARTILLGVFAGLGLGLLGGLVAEGRDTTFADVDALESATTVPVLGTIPAVSTGRAWKRALGRAPGKVVPMLDDPHGLAAEQYQVLAMKLRQRAGSDPSRVIVITSASGGEGKTVTAINLAAALSEGSSDRTILIDADLRKPKIDEYLEIYPVEGRQMNDLLAKGKEPDLTPYVWKRGGLSVIPARSEDNPLSLLSSENARAAIQSLRDRFRFVLIDAPPVLPIADAHVLSGIADEVIFVVRAGVTPRESLGRAIDTLGAKNLSGMVLNDVDYKRSRYRYSYEYYRKNTQQT
jgi:polysaccharide chain length determinant protein (PEP-CTERM system associated)